MRVMADHASSKPKFEVSNAPSNKPEKHRKLAQIYFVVVVIGSTMNFPKVRIFEVSSGDD